MGWTIEEFAALRTFGLRPPQDLMSANTLQDLVEQTGHAQVPMAVNLAKEVMKIDSANSPLVDGILKSEDDVKVALFLSKILSQALLNRMQQNMKAKLQNSFAAGPQVMGDMQKQISKIAAVETALSNKEAKLNLPKPQPAKPPEKPKPKFQKILPPPKEPTEPKENLSEKLKEVERNLAKERDAKLASVKGTSKSKAPVRDARKILESYKESKKPMDINEGLPKTIDEWTPLEYLRHFAMNKKKISMDSSRIYFGRISFPRDTVSNFKAEYGETDANGQLPFFPLDTLYYAYSLRTHKHSKYLEKLRELKKKQKAMNHRDRDTFLKYIDGKLSTAPSNVKRMTRRQLNPDQYLDQIVPTPAIASKRSRTRSPNKYTLEAMQREDELNLNARIQLHLLENQRQQEQMAAAAAAAQQPKRPSRFDQFRHPNEQLPVSVSHQPSFYDHQRPQIHDMYPQNAQIHPHMQPPIQATFVNYRTENMGPRTPPPMSPPPHHRDYEGHSMRFRSRSPVPARRQDDYDPSYPTASPPYQRMPSPRR
jgi:hypothetical protein